MFHRCSRAAWLVVALSAVACGSNSSTKVRSPSNDEREQPATASETAEPVAETSSPESNSAGDTPPANASNTEADTAPRELKYLVTPNGLQISVLGAKFVASAKPIKVGAGWGVRVTVKAKGKADAPLLLLDPKRGPLAFAGSLQRGGEAKRFGDKRDGDDSKSLDSDAIELTRDWPGDSGEKPLAKGDSLTLEVGLWGLGETAETRRPVPSFFVVKLQGGSGKPEPHIEPPAKFQ